METDRLIMRRWRPEDLEPFAALNADPEVMRYFPACLSKDECAAFIERAETTFENYGFGLWVTEHKDSGEFMGFIGLSVPRFEVAFNPCVEIGWRLARKFWGSGYATEGAQKALQFGFEDAGLPEIVSFTYEGNHPSRKVMERLGMKYDPSGDFNHPNISTGHWLEKHVLYRLARQDWLAA